MIEYLLLIYNSECCGEKAITFFCDNNGICNAYKVGKRRAELGKANKLCEGPLTAVSQENTWSILG